MLIELHCAGQALQNKIVRLMQGINIDIRMCPAALVEHFVDAWRNFVHDEPHDFHAVHILIFECTDILLGVRPRDVRYTAFSRHPLPARRRIEVFEPVAVVMKCIL